MAAADDLGEKIISFEEGGRLKDKREEFCIWGIPKEHGEEGRNMGVRMCC